jgi:ABC-type transporter Mla subunit MlaD
VTAYPGLGFDPAPGDPGRVAALAEAAASAARHAADAHTGITGAVDRSRPWVGQAADEFRRRAAELPAGLAAQRDSAAAAADVLFGWAATLADLQRRAEQLDRTARALRARIAAAERLVEEWTTAVSVASTHTRPQAAATLAAHQQELDALHTELTPILHSAAQLAAEHQRAADRVTGELRGTRPSPAALLNGLSTATRRATAVAALTGRPHRVAPPVGAVATALACGPPEPPTRTWVFGGPAVPIDRLRRDLAT